jgi:hypothetical protein
MLKTSILIVAFAIAGILSVSATLGESKAQSIKHYGPAIDTDKYGMVNWDFKGYWISELFNDEGICDLIYYYKKSGEISDREADVLREVNYPKEAGQAWIEQEVTPPDTDPKAHTRRWVTPGGFWYLKRTNRRIGENYYASIVMGNVQGLVDFNRRIEAVDSQSKELSPKLDVPFLGPIGG